MDLSQVLEFLKSQENGEAMVGTVSGKLSALNGEAASWRTKLRESEAELGRIQELAGGDGKALEGKITGLNQQLEAVQTELLAAKNERAEAIAKETGLRQSLLLQDIAIKVGADRTALQEILGKVDPEAIAISDEGVTVNGKPLVDFAAEKGEWVTRALFPTNPPPSLPSGGTGGQPPVDPVAAYIASTYQGVKKHGTS